VAAVEEAAGVTDVATVTPEEIAAKGAAAGTTDSILTTAMAIITEETTETTPRLTGINFRVEGMLVVAAV
jgi:hypothetical protein